MACDFDGDDKDEVLLRIARDRLQHASVVKATLLRHRLMPVSVTNNTSLENKARAIPILFGSTLAHARRGFRQQHP